VTAQFESASPGAAPRSVEAVLKELATTGPVAAVFFADVAGRVTVAVPTSSDLAVGDVEQPAHACLLHPASAGTAPYAVDCPTPAAHGRMLRCVAQPIWAGAGGLPRRQGVLGAVPVDGEADSLTLLLLDQGARHLGDLFGQHPQGARPDGDGRADQAPSFDDGLETDAETGGASPTAVPVGASTDSPRKGASEPDPDARDGSKDAPPRPIEGTEAVRLLTSEDGPLPWAPLLEALPSAAAVIDTSGAVVAANSQAVALAALPSGIPPAGIFIEEALPLLDETGTRLTGVGHPARQAAYGQPTGPLLVTIDVDWLAATNRFVATATPIAGYGLGLLLVSDPVKTLAGLGVASGWSALRGGDELPSLVSVAAQLGPLAASAARRGTAVWLGCLTLADPEAPHEDVGGIHVTGPELRAVELAARRARRLLRASDLLAGIGDRHLVIAAEVADSIEAEAMVRRLQRALSQPIVGSGVTPLQLVVDVRWRPLRRGEEPVAALDRLVAGR
jgi:hypothetical protein